MIMQLNINNQNYEVESEEDTPLLWAIRDELGMTGTKFGCGLAQCGACSVLVDDVVYRSCVTPLSSVVGKKITTIEAIESDPVGAKVVDAWVEHQVPQCGYCQSGQIMTVTSMLKANPNPSEQEIETTMSNLCRCGTYNAISSAIHDLTDKKGDA